ncbi:TlpA disulfide reductase family protein [Emcibacter sp. SYSU 3D8]|uniref:TlpA family protein disulfide reductase n=1 Tax=Emcibacter sp. SYSU 3D8 TaxID=3133969 RepID=UPI0031FF32E7
MLRPIILLLACLLIAVPHVEAKTGPRTKVAVGDMPPDYLGKNDTGGDILASALRGKVVVVTFWATWCGPCLLELPVLQSIREQVSEDRLAIVAINYGQGKRIYRKILERTPDWTLTFAYDPWQRAAKAFGVTGLPHMFIIDKQGKVASVHMGYGEETLAALVGELNTYLTAKP